MRNLILVFFCFTLYLPQLIKHDFKLPPSHSEIPYNPEWQSPPATPETLAILDQPFRYLAHGNQATVFESEDGKYVLKLFRYTRSQFPPLQTVKNWFAKLHHKKPKDPFYTKANKTFKAAHLASTEASQFTQVLFCHLNLSKNELPTLTLKANRTFFLPLDRHRFILQRKVTPFAEALLSVRNDPQELQARIDSFKTLIRERSAQGIRNSDPNLAPNFGFLNGQAVEIDFGNYRKISDPELRAKEIENYLFRLNDWLSKNLPDHQ